jgi:hypothetical protein
MMKELEDYNWFPKRFRRWQLEFVGSMSVWTKLYRPLVPVMDEMISDYKITALQDCCSGSGLPAVYLHQQLHKKMTLLLTDKYPDEHFVNNAHVIYSKENIDVLQMQTVEIALYTMFNAFHHFNKAQQKAIVKKMMSNNSAFIIAEILEPGLFNALKIFFTGTVLQIFAAPFIKPFSFARLFFTYIIPVNLFTVTYDGIISVLRSKTEKQYRELVNGLASNNFAITVHKINNWKGNLVYIKGAPINK